MPAEATPGSCRHACRIAPRAHDTVQAMPRFVQRPTSAQDSAGAGVQRIFPRRFGACVACSAAPPRLDGPWDDRSPSPDRDVAAPQPLALAARRRWHRASVRGAWYHARGLRQWRSRVDRHWLPRRGCASPLVPAVGGMTAHQVSAHPGVAHGGVGGLPPPIDSAPLITGVYKHGPEPFKDAQLTPALEVADARCCRRHTAGAADAIGRLCAAGRCCHAAPGAAPHGEAPGAGRGSPR